MVADRSRKGNRRSAQEIVAPDAEALAATISLPLTVYLPAEDQGRWRSTRAHRRVALMARRMSGEATDVAGLERHRPTRSMAASMIMSSSASSTA